VAIEGEAHIVIGRLTEVRLPERDRLTVEPSSESEAVPSPIGTVQLLSAIDPATGKNLFGIPDHPRIGQRVYSAHPLLLKQSIENASEGGEAKRVQLAVFPHSKDTSVSVSPKALFGRHCAILGATGGGKSWTLATLLEEVSRLGGKAILFDATGEYENQEGSVRHVLLGGKPEAEDERTYVSFPYYCLTETDLFVLFRPSAGAQAPRLRDALKSLKLGHLQPELLTDGLLKKANQDKKGFEAALLAYAGRIGEFGAQFEVKALAAQVAEECVYLNPFGGGAAGKWGASNPQDLGYCTSLIARIEAEVTSDAMACVFQPDDMPSLVDEIESFIADPELRLLRVSVEHLLFEHNTRELVANAVGRYLLSRARAGRFRESPLVVFVDEAHQFLDKSVGDEFVRVQLESFGLIAKEGRKYGLTLVLATQRARDIPEDVCSQMGTFIVHRLINERDRLIVERACGSLDGAAAAFLPTLRQGEAMVVGVDIPVSLPVIVREPRFKPVSRDPDYDEHWGAVLPA
jgi:energy-coupling factor transporter ATP-binding protein EcfA2